MAVYSRYKQFFVLFVLFVALENIPGQRNYSETGSTLSGAQSPTQHLWESGPT